MRSLGRVRSVGTMRAVRLAHYVDADAAPPKRSWIGPDKSFPWFGNDAAGDCAYASLYDRRVLLSRLNGEEFVGTREDCLKDYSATGFSGTPGDATDNGSQMIDVLGQAVHTGIAGDRIEGYARLDPMDRDLMEIAINAFGCVYVGASLTKNVVNVAPKEWDIRTGDRPDHTLGHAFLYGGYDHKGFDVVTWAEGDWFATNKFHETCVDEAWVILDSHITNLAGISIDRLRYDLKQL